MPNLDAEVLNEPKKQIVKDFSKEEIVQIIQNAIDKGIINLGDIGGGSEVVANPTLEGTEPNLEGLEVDGEKYKIPEGTVVEANPTLAGTESPLTGLQVGNTKYAVGGGKKHLYACNLEYSANDKTILGLSYQLVYIYTDDIITNWNDLLNMFSSTPTDLGLQRTALSSSATTFKITIPTTNISKSETNLRMYVSQAVFNLDGDSISSFNYISRQCNFVALQNVVQIY